MEKKTLKDYQKELGKRVKAYRVNLGMTQHDLEEKSGVSSRSISRLEQGASVQLESLIKILRAFNLEENLDLLIPDQTKRPSYYLHEDVKIKQRVRKKEQVEVDFVWGEDK